MTDVSKYNVGNNILHLQSTKTALKLWKCPYFCCIENLSIQEYHEKLYFSLCCEECSSVWYVCHNCEYQNKHFHSLKQLRRHFYTICKDKSESYNKVCTTVTPKKKKKSVINTTVIFKIEEFEKLSSFGRKENLMYYFYEQFQQGPHYLVGLCQYKLTNIAHLLDTYEVYAHFRLAFMFLTMNPLLSHYQTRVFQYYQNNLSPAFMKRKWACTLPLDKATVRRMFTEGSHSILSNLPYPNILNVDHHSYVPMVEIIQDCLANNNPVCDMGTCPSQYNPNNVKYIWESKVVTDLIKEINCTPNDQENPTLHLMLLRWSDDFEPNNVKKNKGNSIWMFTTTIVSLSKYHHCEENTYIISLGHKDADHSEIEHRYIADINSINDSPEKKFYSAKTKKVVSVKLHMIACIADLPERSDVCNISRGNGTFTTRWGFSSHTKLLQKNLRSCKSCFQYCLKNINDQTFNIQKSCNQCLNWDFERNNELSSYAAPKGFPAEYGQLNCFRLSFALMKEACEFGRSKYISKQWTRNQLVLYLSHKGIKMSLITKIISDVESDLLKLPAVWDKPYSLSKWIDAPMHLLFLGVVKKTNSVIDKWATLFSKQKTLMKSFNPMLQYIYHMKLEWCKILPLCPNLTFGGYVSENWVAVCRLICWMYQTIPNVIPNEDVDHSPPEKHINFWTGVEMKKWLVLRGLKRTGRSVDLRSRISRYLENPERIPEVLPKFSCDNKMAEHTIVSLQFLISRLMQNVYNEKIIKECEAYIHLYLGYLAEWTKHITVSNQKPLWISSYSILNLLNLPTVMKQYGPLRNYWEGKTIGEAIVKKVKSNYSCMHSQWYMSLTKKTLQMRSFLNICSKIENIQNVTENIKCKEEISFKEVATNFHIYPDILCLERAYTNGQPISVIITKDFRVFAVVCNDITYEIPIKDYYKECYGLHYYHFASPNQNKEGYLKDLDIFDFGIMLPKLTGKQEFDEMTIQAKYTVITSKWNSINVQKTFEIPNFQYED